MWWITQSLYPAKTTDRKTDWWRVKSHRFNNRLFSIADKATSGAALLAYIDLLETEFYFSLVLYKVWQLEIRIASTVKKLHKFK